jgi:hypothetical protein
VELALLAEALDKDLRMLVDEQKGLVKGCVACEAAGEHLREE